jgi:hypothetical protein
VTTDRPYTDEDLRHEAARQLALSGEDPDFMGIAERMEGSKIPSRDDVQWDQLGDNDFDTAQRAVDDLLTSSADLSEWAVNLGADGLEPSPDQVTVNGDDRPIVRVHFAFDSAMPTAARSAVVAGLGQALADLL